MDALELSRMYNIACARAQSVVIDMYESLHDDKGNPVEDSDLVKEIIRQTIKEIRTEFSLISVAVDENSLSLED